MRKTLNIVLIGSLMSANLPLWAAEDYLNFYKEEAQVVSASLRPQSAKQSPATVYVVTQQDIKDSGAVNWWDVLRDVPGVDVVQFRTGQGEIGIRGMDGPWTNFVLVLVDGRSVMDGFFNHIAWQSLPVTMDEIDRIEVVEGPAAAVYGPNATSGVINIITKTPEQIQGGQATFTGGERSTYQGSALYGKKDGPVSYRFNGGWRSANSFENADTMATEAGLFNGLVNYDFSKDAGASVSGGFNNYNTVNSFGAFGLFDYKGIDSFGRADAHYKDTRLRAFWNQGSNPTSPLDPNPLKSDQYDVQVDQLLNLPFRNALVFGASYHRNEAKSDLFTTNSVHQDLYGAFFEDKWDITDQWLLMGSGRVDTHPLTPARFSPRGSLIYTPVPEHVFRVTAATAYRNPTLLENYLNITQPLPGGITNQFLGTPSLDPEYMEQVEISHTGRFDRLKTQISGFWFRYSKFVTTLPDATNFPNVVTNFATSDDKLYNVGGEVAAEYLLTSYLRLFSNYSYQSLYTASGIQFPAVLSPRHKANAGIRTHSGGWTTSWEVNWVDKRKAVSQIATDPLDPLFYQPVSAYFLVNAHVGYAFSGRLSGLEVGVNAFNLLNHDYYEALPPQYYGGFVYNGEAGEIVRGRYTGTISYKF